MDALPVCSQIFTLKFMGNKENHIYFLHFTEDYILYQLEMSTFPTALPRLLHRVLLPDGSRDYRL